MKAIDRLKTLIDQEAKPEVKLVRYKHAATGIWNKRKGYSLYATMVEGHNRLEYLTIEPVSYSNGDRWMFRGPLTTYIYGYNAVHYAKNISEVINILSRKKKVS